MQALSHMDILTRTREWIHEELKRAELPGQEPFIMTSLTYAVVQAYDKANDEIKAQVRAMRQEVVTMLQGATKREPPYATLDAMRPYRAIFLIDRALAMI